MEEKLLIVKAQKGDKEAFQKLIGIYYPYVLKFLTRLCGDSALAQDLTQDTFLRVIGGIERYDLSGTGRFSTYVLTIAKHLYIDYLRKNRHTLISWEEQEALDPVSLAEQVADQLAVADIRHAIGKLPPEQAEPIRLKYLEEMTLKEIAHRLQEQPNTVKSRIHGGLIKIRRLLRGGDKTDG